MFNKRLLKLSWILTYQTVWNIKPFYDISLFPDILRVSSRSIIVSLLLRAVSRPALAVLPRMWAGAVDENPRPHLSNNNNLLLPSIPPRSKPRLTWSCLHFQPRPQGTVTRLLLWEEEGRKFSGHARKIPAAAAVATPTRDLEGGLPRPLQRSPLWRRTSREWWILPQSKTSSPHYKNIPQWKKCVKKDTWRYSF